MLFFMSSLVPKFIQLPSCIGATALENGAFSNVMRFITTNTTPHFFRATACLYAEPLKKKKRLDPAIIKHREERKKKRLEKQIRRLEKHTKQLKPIEELEIPLSLINEREQRKRILAPPSQEELEQRVLLLKQWTAYKTKHAMYNVQQIDRLLHAQQKALNQLRIESEELYQEAIQFDPGLIPFKTRGPTRTPPIMDYDSPDGEYIDVTKKWEILPGETK